MAKLLFLAICALMAAPICARTFKWSGGNMNFAMGMNWLGGVAPSSNSSQCTTTFGASGTNIISNVDAGSYSVGRVLNLPQDGTLLLASDGAVLLFTEPSPPSCNGDLVWSGGVIQTQNNDFYCHQNWAVFNGSQYIPTTFVPCDGDSVTFDASSSYHTYISPSTPFIVFRDMQLGSQSVISSSSPQDLASALPQVNLFSNTTTVYIGNNYVPVCQQFNAFDSNTARCSCQSSCAVQNNANVDLANLTLTAMNTYYMRMFSGTMNAASLSISQDQFVQALRSPADPTNSAIAAAIVSSLLGLPAVLVDNVRVTISTDNQTVTVTGMMNATAGSILPIGFTSLRPPNNITWAATTAAIPINVTRTQLIAQAVLSSQLYTTVAAILRQQLDQQLSQASTAVLGLVTTISATPMPNATLAVINSNACLSTCGQSCTSCQQALTAALNNTAGVPIALASNLTSQLAALAGSNYNSTLATVNAIGSTIVAASSASNSASEQALRLYSFASPTLIIGRYRSLQDQLLSIALQNYNMTAQLLSQSLTGFQGLASVSELQFSFVSSVNMTAEASPARRRRAVPMTASGLAVTFLYTISCSPQDVACQMAFTANSSMGLQVQDRLDSTVNLVSFAYGQCASANGFDFSCLQAVANTTCVSVFDLTLNNLFARQAALNMTTSLLRCGTGPTYPNGTCLQVNTQAGFTANLVMSSIVTCDLRPTTTTVPTTTTSTTATSTASASSVTIAVGAAASSSGSGASVIPIAAAAAGGALLIAVIVIVVLVRRKKRVSPTKDKDVNRTVVSFENPMYDDDKAVAVPVYQTTDAGEGLYDAPSFSRKESKSNPLYQSEENLSKLDAEAPISDAYLDVSPSNRVPDDVGYLEGQMQSYYATTEAGLPR